MIELLTIPLLALHLLAMNVASAGPLAGVWLARRGSAGGLGRRLGARAVRQSLLGLAVGAISGGAMLLVPSRGMRAALARFPADAYWFAGAELVFSAACMGLVAWLLRGGKAGWLAVLLAAVSATNLLYHFPPLMAVLGEIAADPHWTLEDSIDRRVLLELWRRPEIVSLWAHFVMASFAVAAVAAIWPAVETRGDDDEAELASLASRLGLAALSATVMQLPIGVSLLATDQPSAREAMLGGNLFASVAFGASLLTAFALLQALGSMVWGEGPRVVRRAGWLLIVVVVLMAATLRISRDHNATRGGELASPPRGNVVISGHAGSSG